MSSKPLPLNNLFPTSKIPSESKNPFVPQPAKPTLENPSCRHPKTYSINMQKMVQLVKYSLNIYITHYSALLVTINAGQEGCLKEISKQIVRKK